MDLVTEAKLVDIVADGFDAGIRLAEAVPKDMIAVPFGGDVRFIAVAAPSYLSRHGKPGTPDDLRQHQCIRFRMASGKLFRWEFAKRGQELAVDVAGVLTLDQGDLMIKAAAQGLGIAYVAERTARPYLRRRQVVALLEEWCPWIPGLCLYYPGHRHTPAALRAFITVLREFD